MITAIKLSATLLLSMSMPVPLAAAAVDQLEPLISVAEEASKFKTAEIRPSEALQRKPEVFQNRVCGELLAGLSLAGLKELGREGRSLADIEEDESIAMVYHTAAASILLMEAAEGLDEDSLKEASELSRAIEGQKAELHIRSALMCSQRVSDWLSSGEIIQPAYEQALTKAYNTLPILAAPSSK